MSRNVCVFFILFVCGGIHDGYERIATSPKRFGRANARVRHVLPRFDNPSSVVLDTIGKQRILKNLMNPIACLTLGLSNNSLER